MSEFWLSLQTTSRVRLPVELSRAELAARARKKDRAELDPFRKWETGHVQRKVKSNKGSMTLGIQIGPFAVYETYYLC